MEEIVFDYGKFEYKELAANSLYVKGKFSLNFNPNFNSDFDNYFIFYNFNKYDNILNINRSNYTFHNKIINFGPFYPMGRFKELFVQNSEKKYPIYSQMLVKSKSQYLHEKKVQQNDFSFTGKIEILKVFSSLFSSIIRQKIQFNNPINFIIPVPSKPEYSENNALYICEELHKKLNIPICNDIVRRVSNSVDKEYKCTELLDDCDEKYSILVDDVITKGTTKQNIIYELKKLNIKVDSIITLGKTDYEWLYD